MWVPRVGRAEGRPGAPSRSAGEAGRADADGGAASAADVAGKLVFQGQPSQGLQAGKHTYRAKAASTTIVPAL